jgi:hypothetical protein
VRSQEELLTFVIVGGGFAGVETAGELNDFVRDSVNDYYHNIDKSNIKIVIVQSGNRLLPEMSEQLAQFALENLRKGGGVDPSFWERFLHYLIDTSNQYLSSLFALLLPLFHFDVLASILK